MKTKLSFKSHPACYCLLIVALSALAVPSALANIIPWQLSEVYSSADGSIEIIELSTAPATALLGSGYTLDEVNSAGTLSHFFDPGISQFSGGGYQHLLFATQAYANLPGAITPDYILPNNFLFLSGGTLTVSTISPTPGSPTSLTYTGLPSDGIHALDANGEVITAYAENFAGKTAYITTPEDSGTFGLLLMGMIGLAVCMRSPVRNARLPVGADNHSSKCLDKANSF